MAYFSRKEVVKKCLNDNPATRDSDNALIANVIMEVEEEPWKLTAMNLIENLLFGKYGSIESLTRARRKWQQEFQSLRGQKWQDRHEYQKSVKQELKVFHD